MLPNVIQFFHLYQHIIWMVDVLFSNCQRVFAAISLRNISDWLNGLGALPVAQQTVS